MLEKGKNNILKIVLTGSSQPSKFMTCNSVPVIYLTDNSVMDSLKWLKEMVPNWVAASRCSAELVSGQTDDVSRCGSGSQT